MNMQELYDALSKNQLEVAKELYRSLIGFQQNQVATHAGYDMQHQMGDLRTLWMQEYLAKTQPKRYKLKTDFPVAIYSNDHTYPHGTKNDCTRSPRFAAACERHFGRKLSFLDIGCSGGGASFRFSSAGAFRHGH